MRAAYDQAEKVRIKLRRQTEPEIVREFRKPAGADAPLSFTVEMTTAEARAQLTVELLSGDAPLFRAARDVVLQAGETAQAPLTLQAVPARVEVQKPLPTIESLGETIQLSGAVVFATGQVIPGLALTWQALDPGVVEVTSDGRLVSRTEGEARVEGRYQELSDTVRIHVRAGVASVEVRPATVTLQVSQSLQMEAILRDSRGNQLATHDEQGNTISGRGISWTSSRLTSAQVDAQSGLVTAAAPDTVTITATTSEGRSGSAHLTVIPLPPIVSSCSVSEVSATRATLACMVNPNQAATEVEFAWGSSASLDTRTPARSVGGGSTALEVSETLALLGPGTTYFWRLEATSSGGTTRGEVLSFTTPDVPPAAPDNLVASASGPTAVDLAWEVNSANHTEFRIERETTGGDWLHIGAVGAGASSYTDAGLTPSTTYVYRVRACNGVGCSNPSNEASATTHPAPPAAPSNLTATVAGLQIALAWSDNSNDETAFHIERTTAPNGSWNEIAVVGANQTVYADEDVSAGATYLYRVRAFNAAGGSGYTNVASASVPGPSDPTPPMHVLVDDFVGTVVNLEQWIYYDDPSLTRQDDRLIVTLPQNMARYGGILYRLPHSLAGSSFYAEISQAAAGGPYTETFVGVTSHDEEEYVVLTSLGGKLSAWRQWRGERYARVGAELNFNPTNHRFRRIREQDGTIFFEVSANGTTWTRPSGWSIAHNFTNLDNLHGIVGAGAYVSDPNAGTAIFENVNTTVPAIPHGLTATVGAQNRVDLSWQDRSVNESGFRIERRSGGGAFAPIATVGANVTQYQDSAVEPGTTYEYRVRAFNAAGSSGYTNVTSATTPSPPSPSPAAALLDPSASAQPSRRFDRTSTRGSGVSVHHVCEVGSHSCSRMVAVA